MAIYVTKGFFLLRIIIIIHSLSYVIQFPKLCIAELFTMFPGFTEPATASHMSFGKLAVRDTIVFPPDILPNPFFMGYGSVPDISPVSSCSSHYISPPLNRFTFPAGIVKGELPSYRLGMW